MSIDVRYFDVLGRTMASFSVPTPESRLRTVGELISHVSTALGVEANSQVEIERYPSTCEIEDACLADLQQAMETVCFVSTDLAQNSESG